MNIWVFFDSFKWLTVPELTLCFINLGILIWYAVPIRKYYRWLDFVPSLGLLIAILNAVSGDTSYLAILIYSTTLAVFLCTIKKPFKPSRIIKVPKYRWLRIVLCICGAAPILLGLSAAGEIRYNPVSNLAKLGYAEAFLKMNDRLAVEYPFGDWKGIDWKEMRNKYEPLFQKAEKEKNKALYIQTLKDYVCSIHDGHIALINMDQLKKDFGGGFGIRVIRLDDRSVWVKSVVKGSPADKSGIKVGAEILSWDRKDAKDVYQNTGCQMLISATEQAKVNNQGLFMARAPIGKEIQITVRNMGDNQVISANLQAYDDGYETLKTPPRGDEPIVGKLLDNGYGYVKIDAFPMTFFSGPEKVLEEKLNMFQESHIKGLILDLRDNRGGDDGLVAKLAGYFVKEARIYEYTSYYSRLTGKFEINYGEIRKVKPAKSSYDGKLAILVNSQTSSSGEGLPLMLKGMPNVTIVGFTPTNGSFGMRTSDLIIDMPEGFSVRFPDGRSLNKDKEIQGDSDASGQGGVAPDLKIPLNKETFKQKYVDGQDVELNLAIEALKR